MGDADGTVFWHQGIELYNAARRAGKDMVLLVYEGENHSLAKKPNQLDYHRRIMQWFDHYLKGAPAPDWITKGEKFLEREKALKANQTREQGELAIQLGKTYRRLPAEQIRRASR